VQLYIQNKPIKIIRKKNLRKITTSFEMTLDARDSMLRADEWHGDVLVWYPSADQIFNLFQRLKAQKIRRLDSVTLVVNDPKSASHYLKKRFSVVKAAGGLVEKGDQVLMILRLDKWDLPKGKLEKGESPAEGALREVEEECGVRVKLVEKIGSTWHSYMRGGKHTLKKTYWYRMKLIDDSNMAPQTEEFIDEVRWMIFSEWKAALYNSYPTIRQVFRKYVRKRNLVV